ncbi:collagen alpha-4(VI) chain-like isoform X2 [Physella acuta]|nr:collagen alpha-4(VI) chain-like isoform X2 [Physella acuta]
MSRMLATRCILLTLLLNTVCSYKVLKVYEADEPMNFETVKGCPEEAEILHCKAAPKPTTSATTARQKSTTTTPAPVPPSVQPCLKRTKAGIIFLLDASSSIGPSNWKKQVKFASDVTEGFNVGQDDVRFGTVIFNSDPKKIFDLNVYFNHTSLSKALLDIKYPFLSGTKTYKGLQFILDDKMFSSASGGRPDANDIVIVMTDGKSDNTKLTVETAQRLKDQYITLIAVGIGDQVNEIELTTIANDPSYYSKANDFANLDFIKRDLVKMTCDNI